MDSARFTVNPLPSLTDNLAEGLRKGKYKERNSRFA